MDQFFVAFSKYLNFNYQGMLAPTSPELEQNSKMFGQKNAFVHLCFDAKD